MQNHRRQNQGASGGGSTSSPWKKKEEEREWCDDQETAFIKLMKRAKPLPKKGPYFLQLIELQKSSINKKPIYIVPSLGFVGISQVAIFSLKVTFHFFFFSEQMVLIKAYIWFKGRSSVIIFITLTFQKKIPVEGFSLDPMSTVYSGVGDLVGSSVQTSPLRVLS